VVVQVEWQGESVVCHDSGHTRAGGGIEAISQILIFSFKPHSRRTWNRIPCDGNLRLDSFSAMPNYSVVVEPHNLFVQYTCRKDKFAGVWGGRGRALPLCCNWSLLFYPVSRFVPVLVGE
jgi:hypothetical protein